MKTVNIPPPLKVNMRQLLILAVCVTTCGVAPLAATAPVAAEAAPAQQCLKDLQAFDAGLHKDGYWLDSGGYGYGYPVYGYGYRYGDRFADSGRYSSARPGYEVRTLIAAARVLGDNGQQVPCESVLGAARERYSTYLAELRSGQIPPADVTGWRRQQIETAQPVGDSSVSYRSDQLIGATIVNVQDDSLGSVEDIVISPQTGKIAYLVIGHGGLFGIDEKYTPVPWADFKSTSGTNLLVLTASKAIVEAAPQVRKNQVDRGTEFTAQSQKVDSYWSVHIPVAKN
jgi:sporulation protein YlmC with PRC-barrel domain